MFPDSPNGKITSSQARLPSRLFSEASELSLCWNKPAGTKGRGNVPWRLTNVCDSTINQVSTIDEIPIIFGLYFPLSNQGISVPIESGTVLDGCGYVAIQCGDRKSV